MVLLSNNSTLEIKASTTDNPNTKIAAYNNSHNLAQIQFHLLAAFGPAFLWKAFDRKVGTPASLLLNIKPVPDKVIHPIQIPRIK